MQRNEKSTGLKTTRDSELCESGRVSRRVQVSLQFIIQLEQGDGEAFHIQGCHVVAYDGLGDLDALVSQDCGDPVVADIKLTATSSPAA